MLDLETWCVWGPRGGHTFLEAYQGTGNRGTWGSWVQNQEQQGVPKETVLFPDRKHMLQLSKDWRRAGGLPGMLWLYGEWCEWINLIAGSRSLGLRLWESQFSLQLFPKVCVSWDKSLNLSDPSFSYLVEILCNTLSPCGPSVYEKMEMKVPCRQWVAQPTSARYKTQKPEMKTPTNLQHTKLLCTCLCK